MVTLSAFRPSFRQLLIAAFLVVASLLAAVSLRGLVTLQSLLERSRAGAEQALRLNGHVERLGEHGVAMERAARQYLVLGDTALRTTFDRAADDAAAQVRALAESAVPQPLADAWRDQVQSIGRLVATASPPHADLDAALARDFRDLDTLANQMAERVRAVTEQRNADLQAELEAGRAALARQVVATIAVSLALALGLALVLAMPLRRVERAIVALGENRLDHRIEIRGPSDVRQIGRQLDWLRQRLAQGDADKARFLRHVSHELKTPLAALREGVALLGDGVAGPLSDDQREVTRILADNTATLQRRIEDLLRFNAAAFAAQRLVRKATDLGALMDRLIDEQKLQWQARGLRVALALQPAGSRVWAHVDADLLGMALSNLLSNAIRFSPAGATIHVDMVRVDRGVRIDIADEGPGVAEGDRARIFEPFFRGQSQPSGGLAGSGIGLSIVAETVAAHGGRIVLLPSTPGARFRIELPHALAD